jgi:hypothetical protein
MSSAAQGPIASSTTVSGTYHTSPPVLTNGQTNGLEMDVNGNLKTSDQTPIVAGTNLIGKVGIDQTTPGTTNGVQVNAALPVGANVIGKVSIDQTTPGTTNLVALAANQSINNAQVNGVTIQTGVGASGTGTQRVAVSTDSFPTTYAPTYVSVKNEMDTALQDASVTNINGNAGAFVQVVSSLGNACKKIFIADTTGQFIGVYTGAPGSEALAFIINPGINQYREHAIAAATRISVRNMAAAVINLGQYIMEFSS